MTEKGLYSIARLKELQEDFGFEFKKALGQNFLIDGNIIRKIAEESGITKDTTVMEIGPGIGTLTEELAKHAKKVIAFELDESLTEIHKETLGSHDNVEVIYKDFMDASVDEIKALTGGAFKVCANLPYYVTTPILTFLLESRLDIDSITVMVQKEVAQRIVADEKSKDYGSISVFTRAYGDARIAFNVSKDCFYPKPKVDSAVLYIEKKKKDLANEELFLKIIRAAFMKRRKTLANALFNSEVGIDKKDTVAALKAIGKGENARAEELSFDDFVSITRDLEGDYGK